MNYNKELIGKQELKSLVNKTVEIFNNLPSCDKISEALIEITGEKEANREDIEFCCQLEYERFKLILNLLILHSMGIISINISDLDQGTIN